METPVVIAAKIFEAFGQRDPDAVLMFFADDVIDDYVPLRRAEGKAEARQMMVEIFDAFPDFTLRALQIVGDSRFASVQWVAKGTFTGANYQGLVANGKSVEVRGCDFMEIEDGLLRKNTVYFDYASFARELGVLPDIDSFLHTVMLESFNTVTRVKDGVTGLIRR